MKQLLFTVLFFFAITLTNGQEINWMSMNEALAAQKEEPKKIFVDVYTVWCGPCKLLDKNTFSNKDVINYINKHFYPVKFNAEGNEEVTYNGFTYTNPQYQAGRKGRNATHLFTRALKVTGYPSLAYFDEEGTFIQAVAGYRTPQQLEIFLKMMVTDDYKKLTTSAAWNEYQKNFKPTFQ